MFQNVISRRVLEYEWMCDKTKRKPTLLKHDSSYGHWWNSLNEKCARYETNGYINTWLVLSIIYTVGQIQTEYGNLIFLLHAYRCVRIALEYVRTPWNLVVLSNIQQEYVTTSFSEASFLLPPSVKHSSWDMSTIQIQKIHESMNTKVEIDGSGAESNRIRKHS